MLETAGTLLRLCVQREQIPLSKTGRGAVSGFIPSSLNARPTLPRQQTSEDHYAVTESIQSERSRTGERRMFFKEHNKGQNTSPCEVHELKSRSFEFFKYNSSAIKMGGIKQLSILCFAFFF